MSSSHPIYLADGTSVCRDHLLPVCCHCCVDYSYMRDGTHNFGQSLFLGQRFQPASPTATPATLFSTGIRRGEKHSPYRFIRNSDSREFLVYTDGACPNNGFADAQAGCAFYYFDRLNQIGCYEFPLELRGPTGTVFRQTNNRAELRAAIGALTFFEWPGRGFKRIVIATDSEYVVNGATDWCVDWLRNRWTLSNGRAVMNQDLWGLLLGEITKWRESGFDVSFWRIPRALNAKADTAAKRAANDRPWEDYTEL